MDSMEVEPVLMVGLGAGVTRSLMRPLGENRYVFEKGYADFKSKTHTDAFGYVLGIQFEYNLNRFISLNFSPSFENFGYSYTTTIASKNPASLGTLITESRQTLNYLTLPLLLRARITYKNYKVYGQAGFFTSNLLGASKFSSVSSSIISSRNDTKNNFASNNAGFILGGGLMYKRKNLTFNTDVRFINGFNNIVSKPYYYESLAMDYYDIPDDVKLRGFELTLGVFYNFKYRVYDKKK
jgi:hypothetical protein